MNRIVLCSHCCGPAEYCNNKEIYGQSYGAWPMVWLCRQCNAYVGCHKNSITPLGTLANAETRDWRKRAKEPFLELVATRFNNNRTTAYKWLAEQMGIDSAECHFGMFNVERCKLALAVVTEHNKQ